MHERRLPSGGGAHATMPPTPHRPIPGIICVVCSVLFVVLIASSCLQCFLSQCHTFPSTRSRPKNFLLVIGEFPTTPCLASRFLLKLTTDPNVPNCVMYFPSVLYPCCPPRTRTETPQGNRNSDDRVKEWLAGSYSRPGETSGSLLHFFLGTAVGSPCAR